MFLVRISEGADFIRFSEYSVPQFKFIVPWNILWPPPFMSLSIHLSLRDRHNGPISRDSGSHYYTIPYNTNTG